MAAGADGRGVRGPGSVVGPAGQWPQPPFEANVVLDAEPELPIAFVVTDAMSGTVLNFRMHLMHVPRPEAAPESAG